ncbi:bacteriocin [Dickeya undicola]
MNMNEELEFNEIVEGDVLTEEEMMAISGGNKAA